MDETRFDHITRTLESAITRRRTLRGLGSALTGLLIPLGSEEAAAACVKPGKVGCDGPKNGTCCPGARCKGGNMDKPGRCVCTRSRKRCGNECVNLKNDKRHCGACNKRCKGRNTCQQGRCTSKRGCKVGQNLCRDPVDPKVDGLCGGDGQNVRCYCITDFHGVARCSDFEGGFCSNCTRNADCPDGFVCFRAIGPLCECDQETGSNGNACVHKDCGSLSGSAAGAGEAGMRVPLLR